MAPRVISLRNMTSSACYVLRTLQSGYALVVACGSLEPTRSEKYVARLEAEGWAGWRGQLALLLLMAAGVLLLSWGVDVHRVDRTFRATLARFAGRPVLGFALC